MTNAVLICWEGRLSSIPRVSLFFQGGGELGELVRLALLATTHNILLLGHESAFHLFGDKHGGSVAAPTLEYEIIVDRARRGFRAWWCVSRRNLIAGGLRPPWVSNKEFRSVSMAKIDSTHRAV